MHSSFAKDRGSSTVLSQQTIDFTMKRTSSLLLLLALSFPLFVSAESLPPLIDGKSPQTVDEAWAGYDPTVEPLEIEICKQWEEEGVVLRAVRYCIGTFKGRKSWMGALYGFPKGEANLPGLVQIHGGGGMASKSPCIDNAKRGYATLSLSWRADDRYLERYDLPARAQTDWGAVEGRQVAESRGIEADNDKRYDPVPSARNTGYFLRVLAARRGLTFLDQQPEVDGSRLGVDGHSMGGVITLQTAAMDDRVKAAAPSCAPPLVLDGSLKARTASPNAYASHIKGPILFMSPPNDFHGRAEDVAWIIDHMPSKDFRISRSVHLNHKHTPSSLAAKERWFDAKLKEGFTYPEQPGILIDLTTGDRRPRVTITPDDGMPIAFVDVFYTRDAKEAEYATNRTRYWQFAKPEIEAGTYSARLDLFDIDKPLWVFANVYYKLTGESALTKASDTFTVSTRLVMLSAKQLAEAGTQMDKDTRQIIESFEPGWEKEWIISGNKWETWKLNHPRVPLPQYGKLILDVQSREANRLSVDIGGYRGSFNVEAEPVARRIDIQPFDLVHKTTKARLLNWSGLKRPMMSLSTSRSKPAPIFAQFRWENIAKEIFMATRPFQLGDARGEDAKVGLTFELADQVVGRFDPDAKSVRVDEALGDVDLTQGLQVHAQGRSELTYFLKGAFSTFSATLVPCYQASVTFEVHGDGKKLFESGKFRGKTPPQDISVEVSGVQELKLVVTEGGNGWGGDWVMWANPMCQ